MAHLQGLLALLQLHQHVLQALLAALCVGRFNNIGDAACGAHEVLQAGTTVALAVQSGRLAAWVLPWQADETASRQFKVGDRSSPGSQR